MMETIPNAKENHGAAGKTSDVSKNRPQQTPTLSSKNRRNRVRRSRMLNRLPCRKRANIRARLGFALILVGAAFATSVVGHAMAMHAATGPGSLISMQPMPGPPQNAMAYRVLYQSKGLSGEAIPVSGVIIVPFGPAPAGGRPVVAWAHPTTGVVSRCAPSLARVFFASVQGLRAMLERGYIVAATDYPGLGISQTHPYLVGISEGRAVLDSVRAARQIGLANASRNFAVWGHSQGGQAALYTGLLAAEYAPELRLVGVAAAAPATDLGRLMTEDLGTGGGNNIAAMAMWSWSRVYGAPLERVVTPEALPVINRLASLCIERWFDMLARRGPTRALERDFLLVHDLADVDPWRGLLAENSPGTLSPAVPVFIAQGDTDNLVRPSVTDAYVGALCRRGSKVRYEVLPGVGHTFVARDSANDAIAWIAERFAEMPPPNDCRQPR
jgi:acetyl esterase/lipase